ncbi:MAG: hypothetical protein ACI353_07215 [Alloprevotella sp.]
MEKTSELRRYRGSAVRNEEGVFIFTPYREQGESEKSLQLVETTQNGTLWMSVGRQPCYSFRLKITDNQFVSMTEFVRQAIRLYAAAADIHRKKRRK